MTIGQTTDDELRAADFWRRPGPMTEAGADAAELAALPRAVGDIVRIVQGLLVHLHTGPLLGIVIPAMRQDEPHLRALEAMLARIRALDPAPLGRPRPVERRLVGVCRHHVLLLVAILRAQGVPARARVGFATYFDRERLIDHWVAEWWSGVQGRWIMVDPQLDAAHRARFEIGFDPLDLPAGRFLSGPEAWRRMRTGRLDPERCGIMELHGPWFVAGNVIRDLAALARIEMLPWDVWGAVPQPGTRLDPERLAWLDRLAALAAAPVDPLPIARLFRDDPQLRVPGKVFNALRLQLEPV